MLAEQARHIYDVLLCLRGGVASRSGFRPDIVESWQRCVYRHGLDPEKLHSALILPQNRLREHQDALGGLVSLARHGLHALWKRLCDMDYVVLLADNQGVVVETCGNETDWQTLKQTGLHLGALWNEGQNGTSAIGMVVATGNPVTVHRNDHFDATHINLTCSAAPIYDSQNRLCAVLDVSSAKSPYERHSQHWAAQLVRQFAALVEHAALIQAHRGDWLVRLGQAPAFLDVSPEYLMAVDHAGRICGANHAFHEWAQRHLPEPLLGSLFEQVFGQSLITVYGQPEHTPVCSADNQLFYARVSPPADKSYAAAGNCSGIALELAKLCGPRSSQRESLQRLSVLADTQVPILINGETGTGKEWLARAVHASGSRAGKPFIAVNCAAIPENLIESELYGYAPHSFSGADSKGKPGLIRAADGGTLFLDEIGDMPLLLQSRLLRVLSEREVMPVGSTRAEKVDVRIISATHCDLQERIAAGKFREDLYYRLNGVKTTLPPLRKRDDFDYIVRAVLEHAAERTGKPVKPFSTAALATLRAYGWPGNLRQLGAALEIALLSAQGERIEEADLPEYLREHSPSAPAAKTLPDKQILQNKQSLAEALQAAGGSVTSLARSMGVSRMTVYRYLKKYGLG